MTRLDDGSSAMALRSRILPSGKITYYIDYVNPATGKRETESLRLSTNAKPKNADEKRKFKETRELAEKIYTAKKNEFYLGEYGYNKNSKGNVPFLDYFYNYIEKSNFRASNHSVWICTYRALQKVCDKNILLKSIDTEMLNQIRNSLQNGNIGKNGGKISVNTAASYFRKIMACLKYAYNQNDISKDPRKNIKHIKEVESEKHYLKEEELKLLAKDIDSLSELKQAFLFGCLTGLRISDIANLTGDKIRETGDGQYEMVFNQQKTTKLQTLPLPDQLVSLVLKKIANCKSKDQKIFTKLPAGNHRTEELMKWMKQHKIDRKITFHCSRHTFAVLALRSGVDIYRVSKVLGHSFIKTTEVYVDIMNDKLIEAMNKIPKIIKD